MTRPRKTLPGLPPSALHCSFCGKSQHEVRRLVTGPAVFICDGCAFGAVDVLADLGILRNPDDVEAMRSRARQFAERTFETHFMQNPNGIRREAFASLVSVMLLDAYRAGHARADIIQ